MERRNLQASREALEAIKSIVGDALVSAHRIRPQRPQLMRLNRLELAYGLKRLQHFQLVHYLRCDASRDALLIIRQSIETTLHLVDQGDNQTTASLFMAEPYRHHLYASVIVAALQAAERDAIRQEMEYWRRRNALKIVDATDEPQDRMEPCVADTRSGDPGVIAKMVHQEQFEEFSELKIIPRWNVAPGKHVAIVRRNKEDKAVASIVKWGLIPSCTKGKPKMQPVNARSDKVAISGMYKQALERRRCLVPADGFHEWVGEKPNKVPHFLCLKSDESFAFAGIWERWRPDPEAEPIDTCCFITTEPNSMMEKYHHRQPVMLLKSHWGLWLDRERAGTDVMGLLKPLPSEAMVAWPVSGLVTTGREHGPETIGPAA